MIRSLILKKNSNKGQSLIETLVALGVFILVVSSIVFLIVDVYLTNQSGYDLTAATFLAEEGIEAARSIRDNSWNNLTLGTHGLINSGGNWIFSGIQDDLSTKLKQGIRRIIVEGIDSSRKKVTSQVQWNLTADRPQDVTLITYLTNWRKRGIGDWTRPFHESGLDIAEIQDGLKIQIQGDYAYVVRNDGTPDFIIVDIASTTAPSIIGSYSLAGIPTNIFISGNYAYVSSRNDTEELQIINIANPASPTQVGSYNAAGTADALGVYVNGTTVYFVRSSSSANELFIIDASNPISPALFGSLNLNASGYEIEVFGNYAYIASDHNGRELQIVNVTIPDTPVLSGFYDAAGQTNAYTLSVFQDRVVLGQGATIRLINVATPNSPTLISSFNSGDIINDLSLGNGNLYVFAATASSTAEFQIIDLATQNSPTQLGYLNLLVTIDGVSYHPVKDRAFIAGSNDAEEFVIIAPR